MKDNTVTLELNFKQLDILTELAFCGHRVLNYEGSKISNNNHDELLKILAEKWKKCLLIRGNETEEELKTLVDYLYDFAHDRVTACENARFPKLLDSKLSAGIKEDILMIKDLVVKSKIFDK